MVRRKSAATAVRNRSSLTALPLPRALDAKLVVTRGAPEPLATPPAGSGLKAVPGDFGPPLIGHSVEALRFGLDFWLRLYEHYGPVSWTGLFGKRIVMLAGPDAAQLVLTNKDKVFSQRGWHYFADRFFHRGLMLLDFEEHLRHRRIMQEAFTRHRLGRYADEMAPVIRNRVQSWPNGTDIQLYWMLKELTLDVATRVFVGTRPDHDDKRVNRAFVDAVRAGTAIVRFSVPGGRWSAGIKGRKFLEQHLAASLPLKRKSDTGDLFSALCHSVDDDGQRFSDEDVINHMIFLMMAAHDTATITATATAHNLGKHPEWQERARAESLALGDHAPSTDELDSLRTLDLVIKESLRLVAPVPNIPRITTKDTDILGHYVPAGTSVAISPMINHFLPDYWSSPMKFEPDRFAEPRREDKSHRFAWLPFGGGVHKCIGMHFGTYEVKAILHEMLRHYRWSLPADYEVRWDYAALPVPVDGLPMRLDRR